MNMREEKRQGPLSEELSTVRRGKLIDHFVEQLSSGNGTIFAGAGMSIDAGMPQWYELMKEVFKDLQVDKSAQGSDDLYNIAEMFNQHNSIRSTLTDLLTRRLTDHKGPTANHRMIARLPLRKLWTSNFDTLLEDAIRESGKRLTCIKRDEDFAISRTEDIKLYKMHGCITLPEKMVMTKGDVQSYEKNYQVMSNAFFTALAEDTFLFLGFSFTDPHFEAFLGRLKLHYAQNIRQHFAVIKRPEEVDRRFSLFIDQLKDYGIMTLVVDDYAEITLLLRDIEKACNRKNIFISGSFDKQFHSRHVELKEYEGPDSFYREQIVGNLKGKLKRHFPYSDGYPKVIEEIMHDIGRRLIEERLKIFSGYGQGISDMVVEGASAKISENKEFRSMMDQLKIFPLPLKRDVAAFQNDFYRESLIGACGIMVIARGATHASDYASGTFREYNIAKALSNLRLARQKEICHEFGVFQKDIRAGRTGEQWEKLNIDRFIYLYDEQRKIVISQFREVIEMFYRTLYEQWKLIIRSMDSYAKRMTTIIGEIAGAALEKDRVIEIEEKWKGILGRLHPYIASRSVMFYSIFEKKEAGIDNPFKDREEEQEILGIAHEISILRELFDAVDPSPHNSRMSLLLDKAKAICRSFIKLIQGDYKYSKITCWLEEFNEAELGIAHASTASDWKDLATEPEPDKGELKKVFAKIAGEITELRKQLQEKAADKDFEHSIYNGLHIQLDYLDDPGRMDQLKPDKIDQYVAGVYLRLLASEKNVIAGLKPSAEPADMGYLDEQMVLHIQIYKLFLVLSDVIGGVQRLKADYEHSQIPAKVNDNDRLKMSFFEDPDAAGEGAADNNEQHNDSQKDPFFYDPAKFEKFLTFHKSYIEFYTYHVNILKGMVEIKKNIKEVLGILKVYKPTGPADQAECRDKMRHKLEKAGRTMGQLEKLETEYEKNALNYRSLPFRSATIILPIGCLGGMAKKIWREERIRFDYLCSNKKNFDPETRYTLMKCYDDLYRINFVIGPDTEKGEREQILEDNKRRLMEAIFYIIEKFQQPPKVGSHIG